MLSNYKHMNAKSIALDLTKITDYFKQENMTKQVTIFISSYTDHTAGQDRMVFLNKDESNEINNIQ